MSQGVESNNSGKFLEAAIEREFRERGVQIRQWAEGGGNGDLFAPQVLWKNRPYKNLAGGNSRGEFVYHDFQFHEIRIECRWQQVPGSCDEKLPCFIWNARDAMPEPEVWLVLDGGGTRTRWLTWAQQQAKQITSKTIRIVNLAEARVLIKQHVLRAAA